ncbi:hypothetical protein A3D03_03455 [Candidatus Gottesmanbacteria bacterium RIFCSPHIGHO2_02_FULL_40_13]|uniref:Ribbon-helix-helix protein CopG domain-containing protein n=1 Tax=Candidatus Gottesmanbacteria bacterium RIFCSPHIGHO2_02_FULL_40_13 TaxID=1798384 RepID=A0A1F6ACB4_9BACT|nr:MAG: hypothetical protein A3D03_03455 [Candidatus Gottesmanbacteria bacterium RIFCSPHIGHO2_02_FULL_40_13]
MIRTQVYLPEETHHLLMKLARRKGTSFSQLVREGVDVVVRKTYGKLTPQKRALKFFAHFPNKWRVKLSDSAVDLIRKERD